MDKLLKVTAIVVTVLLVVVAAFGAGLFYDRARSVLTVPGMKTPDLEAAVSEVAEVIQGSALVPSSEESMTVGAIRGLLESLEDSHAVYFDARHFEYFNEQNSGTFYGIGITIANEEDDLVIQSVIEETPAERAGLRAQDVIVTIDGESRERWDTDEAVLRIRGEEGTTVVLGIRRDDAEHLQDFSIQRAKIDVPNIESEILEGDIGYIRLYSFTEPSAEDVREVLAELAQQGAEGYILDLRDNPGGLLSSSVEIASLFVDDGVIVRVEDRSGTVEQHHATGMTATDAAVVVLINGNSASASEIVAGALQDHGRAVIVGERSFGKGSVQQLEELSFGGAIKLTIAHYVTPKNRVIDKVGLEPDVRVEMEPELAADHETDTQLRRAMAELRERL
ncbi:MAG: S41 family peptidase [Coriobacteriia bacterium]